MEDEDHIYVDENYVVTISTFTASFYFSPTFYCLITKELNLSIYYIIKGSTKTAEGSICKDTLDEFLIEAVKKRRVLYDYTIPVSHRTNLKVKMRYG